MQNEPASFLLFFSSSSPFYFANLYFFRYVVLHTIEMYLHFLRLFLLLARFIFFSFLFFL